MWMVRKGISGARGGCEQRLGDNSHCARPPLFAVREKLKACLSADGDNLSGASDDDEGESEDDNGEGTAGNDY